MVHRGEHVVLHPAADSCTLLGPQIAFEQAAGQLDRERCVAFFIRRRRGAGRAEPAPVEVDGERLREVLVPGRKQSCTQRQPTGVVVVGFVHGERQGERRQLVPEMPGVERAVGRGERLGPRADGEHELPPGGR